MNVASDGVRLIAKDEAQSLFNFAEILLRIDTNQSAGWAILFA